MITSLESRPFYDPVPVSHLNLIFHVFFIFFNQNIFNIDVFSLGLLSSNTSKYIRMFAFNRCQLCTKRAVKVRKNTAEKTVQHCTPWAVIFAWQVRAGRGAVKASRVYRPVNVCRSIICEQMFHAQLRRILGHFDGMNSAGSEISGRYRGYSCTY